MSYSTRGSGGGGFGGFPFKSAHQQGTDNNNGGRGRNSRNRNKFAKRKKRGGPLTCQAFIKVAPDRRRVIIGKKGATVKRITDITRCIIDVPGVRQNTNPNAMVKIQASCVTFLLHACWEISHLVLREGERAEYTLHIEGLEGISLCGHLMPRLDFDGNSDGGLFEGGAFMAGKGNDMCMSAYCFRTSTLDVDGISILVDNEKFVDPSIAATVDVIPDESKNSSSGEDNGKENSFLVFVFGSCRDKTKELFSSIVRQSLKIENSALDHSTDKNR